MSWYGPQLENCLCSPEGQCNGTYTIISKAMINWAPIGEPKTCSLTWLIEVDRLTYWRIWVSDGLGGPRTLWGGGSTLSPIPGGDYAIGPVNGGSTSSEPNLRLLYELEIKYDPSAVCEWFKIDECWWTFPVIDSGLVPCVWQDLSGVAGGVCIFAGDIGLVELSPPATSVTVSGYTDPPMANINGTFSVSSEGNSSFTDSPFAFWYINQYYRRASITCEWVSIYVESHHWSQSYPGYPAVFFYAWNSKSIQWTDVSMELLINRMECVSCDVDCIEPTLLSGKDGTKTSYESKGQGTPPPGWPVPNPKGNDGTVSINL